MPDYQKMYLTLFNAVTDAIKGIEDWNIGAAKEILIRAQQDAEELYISGEIEQPKNQNVFRTAR